jgi:hypothetical protein
LEFPSTAPGAVRLEPDAEVYTDWGLCEKGKHVSTQWETTPRIATQGSGLEVTFTGTLRMPPWNTVQSGPVTDPPLSYRLTYALQAPSSLKVVVGLTPSKDLKEAQAFLAYRMPFAGVDSWEVRGTEALAAQGKPGDRPEQRVFESHGDSVEFALRSGSGSLVIRSMSGAQNPLLVDSGSGHMQVFFALLDGKAVTLPAGQELSATFTISVE